MLSQFETYLLKEKRCSEHTVIAYIGDLEEFAEFAGFNNNLSDYHEANKQLIRGWIVQLSKEGIKAKSISRKLSTLRTFFKWLQKNGLLDTNPTSGISGPKVQKRLPEFVQENVLKEDNIETLFSTDFYGKRDQLLLELFYQTGIRLSELIQLKESDVSNQTIKVLGKRNKERIIAISNALSQQISELSELKKQYGFHSPYLLVNDKGTILYPKFVYRKINYYLSRVSSLKKKSPHILRHTFATHMLNNGVGLEVLKEILGHESLAATQIYTHNSFAQINDIYKHAHPREQKNKEKS